jgi:dUTP pyrophosphatase
MIVAMRSGIALKTKLRQPNGIGVIDSDYRGEVAMMFDNILDGYHGGDRYLMTLNGDIIETDTYQSDGAYIIRKGDRVAQAFIQPLPRVNFVESAELSETERGDGGFGSTGTV